MFYETYRVLPSIHSFILFPWRGGGAPHQLNLNVAALVVVAARFLIRRPLKTPVATKGRARSPTPPINPQTKPHASGINWKNRLFRRLPHCVPPPRPDANRLLARARGGRVGGTSGLRAAAFCISGELHQRELKGR